MLNFDFSEIGLGQVSPPDFSTPEDIGKHVDNNCLLTKL